MFINYLIILIILFMSIAFYTIMERKILGIFHLRIGPNKVGILGLFQPFSDVSKLFSKNSNFLSKIQEFYWNMSPILTFMVLMYIMNFIPIKMENNKIIFNLMLMMLMFSIPIYTIFWSSLFSLNKFSIISSKRCITQMISYEMGLMMFLVIMMVLMMKLNIFLINTNNMYSKTIKLYLILMMILLIMAESSRIPFDFVESESELVSGFNIEYSSMYFSLFFVYEYGMMIFFSLIFSMMLMNLYFSFLMIFFFIHFRSSYPRLRYDQMMIFFWKLMYPILLSILITMKFVY